MPSTAPLLRSSLLVGAGAAASRLIGFLRDILFAQVLGAGPVADAFLAAFRLPNLVRRILSEGGLNPALVPALARTEPLDAPRFAGEVFAVVALALAVLLSAVELAAGLAVLVLAPGLAGDALTLDLATLYTRLAFPLVAGVTLASLVGAALNHRRRFLASTLAPLATNAALVVVLVLLEGSRLPAATQAAWLAGAASAAGLLQLAGVAVAFRGADAPIRLVRPRWSPSLRKLLARAGLTLVAGGSVPLIVLVGTQVASFTPSALSWLHYADRLVQLPLGLIGAVTSIVLLPEWADRLAKGHRDSVAAAQNRAIETGFLVACPAACALIVLAEPIAAVLFERGAFGPADTRGTAAALAGMSFGLPFAAAGKVFAQSLFAQGGTRAMLAALAASLAGTAGAALLLGPSFGALGYGLAVASGFALHAWCLAAALRRERLLRLDRRLAVRAGRIAVSSACLGIALGAALQGMHEPPGPLGLAALCLGGFAFYAAAAVTTGALERGDFAPFTKKA
jgi:putative peptidoglycan lipid II flippase